MFADNVGEHRGGGTLLSALTDVAMGGVGLRRHLTTISNQCGA